MSGHAQLIPIRNLVGPRRWNKWVSIGYKTKAIRSDAGFSILLHRTRVVSFTSDTQELVVTTGGWHSGITAQRINHGLFEFGLQLLTRDLPGRWRVADYKGNAFTMHAGHLRLRRISDNDRNHGDCAWERIV